jgi:hypothetical protein
MTGSRLALVLAALVLAVAGCGDKTKEVTTTNASGQVETQTVPDVHFAKTKFVLHGGLAYGAFHRYIYKPYRAGSFRSGGPKHKRSIAKAALATAFIVHELKQMNRAALSDDDLRPVAQKIGNILPSLSSLAAALKAGNFGTLDAIKKGFDGIVGDAKAAGVDVPKDKAPPIGG